MLLLSPRVRPLLALMQGLLRTVRAGRQARHLDTAGLHRAVVQGRRLPGHGRSGPVTDDRRRLPHQPLACLSSGGSHRPRCFAPPSRGAPMIERLGARWGTSPAARDGRVACLRACASREDPRDVRAHPEPPGRPRRRSSYRPFRPASKPPKHSSVTSV